MYRVADPFGTPSLELVVPTLERRTSSIVWEGDTLYGIQGANLDPPQTLVTIDPGDGYVSPVGTSGATGIDPEQVGGLTIKNGVMWALQNLHAGELFTIDYKLTGGPEPTATFVRTTSPDTIAFLSCGLAIDPADAQLWAMIRSDRLLGSDIGVYQLDETTGQLTLMFDLSELTDVRGASGIAVIPEPASLALLLVASLLVIGAGNGRRVQRSSAQVHERRSGTSCACGLDDLETS